jgi:peroxiredoxin
MKKWIYVVAVLALAACKDSTKPGDPQFEKGGPQFEVSGVITNSTAKMVYLEEVPAGGTQGTIVDSFAIGKEGRYELNTGQKESLIYNLRLDHNMYPVVAVINDVPKIVLNVELSGQDNQFAQKYEVKGSPASEAMKDFMYTFNNDLQRIYSLNRQTDSLKKNNVPDSAIVLLVAEQKAVADKIRNYSLNSISQAKDPALVIFELGYYQSTANDEQFGLSPIDIEEVSGIVNSIAAKFPAHQGVVAVKESLDKQLEQYRRSMEPRPARWVGKPAPDFSLPDINGKEVRLSSFKGKYVLVDFWASWCQPCREENPNVVRAYSQFRDKNFTIVGVSLDRPGQKDQWLKAIKSDNLTWTHLSDLKYWDSSIIPLYGIDGIPYNVLVDPQGMVIAENLKGVKLEAKLKEVLIN